VGPAPRLGTGQEDEFGLAGAGFGQYFLVGAADTDADPCGVFVTKKTMERLRKAASDSAQIS
jgi:hypothetical protein